MQDEPSEAEPPKRNRRWFQFSLRSLLIGVTLLAIPVGLTCFREVRVAQRRQSLLDTLRKYGGDYQPFNDANPPAMSFIRRWAGDQAIVVIWLPKSPDYMDPIQIKNAFQESQFIETDRNASSTKHR
jgi:hypothetical protein